MTQSKPLIQLYSEQHFPAQKPKLLSLTMLCPDDSITHTSIQSMKTVAAMPPQLVTAKKFGTLIVS